MFMHHNAFVLPVTALLLAAACNPSSGQGEGAGMTSEAAGEFAIREAEALPEIPGAAARDQALAHLREGQELRRRGEAAEAEASFDRAIAVAPHFRDWAHLIAAMAAAEARDPAGAQTRLDRIQGGAPAEWAWRVQAAMLREMGDLPRALSEAERSLSQVHTPSARAGLFAEIGDLRRELGDANGALSAYRSAMDAERTSAGALRAARAAIGLSGLSPADQLLAGRTLLAHGGVDRGIAAIDAYLRSGAGTEAERGEVRLEAGRALFRARNWAGAHRHFSAVSNTSAEAALLSARSQYRLGNRDEGRAGLLSVPRRFPNTDQAAEALFLVADLDHDAGRVSSARELYRQAVATGAEHVAATDAAIRLAGIAILAGDAATAQADIQRFLADRPRDRRVAPAVYWEGRAHLLAGNRDRARASFEETLRLDPFSYYGGLAAERLGGSIGEIPLAPSPAVEAAAGDMVDLALFRMDLLRDLEMNDAASFEMALLRGRTPGSSEALYRVAEGMIERGQPIAGALLGREIHRERGEWDERLLRIVFQFPYRNLVEREARRNNLDPFMVAGLIRQESLFNPVAVSPVGALGLMQVMPGTGRGLASGAGIRNFQPSMLQDPEVNVRLGTLFLAQQMRRWNGNRNDVFAAYNAGPNRVVRWRTYPERADEDVYVERIPIAETRDYVKKVRFHTHVYRRLYGAE
jgi:soluble lytic murein transglycosylase